MRRRVDPALHMIYGGSMKDQSYFPARGILLILCIFYMTMAVGTSEKLEEAQRQVKLRDEQIVDLGDRFIPRLLTEINNLRDRVEISEMKFSHERWRMRQAYPEMTLRAEALWIEAVKSGRTVDDHP